MTNAGRRPAIVTSVAFLSPKRGWVALPWTFLQETPFTLREGEYKTLLLYRDQFTAERPPPPKGSLYHVADSLRHTWPRSARVRLRLRRWGNWWRKRLWKEDAWEAARKLYGGDPETKAR